MESDFIDKTEFTVMIALIKNKKPILGVINWPTENTLFVAQVGFGAFRYANEEWIKIQVSIPKIFHNLRLLDQDIIYPIRKKIY